MAKDDYSYSIVQRNKRRGIMTWYARIYNIKEQTTRYVSLKTTKKGEATALLAEKVTSREFEEPEGERLTFRKAIVKFLDKCEMNGVTQGSILAYRLALTAFDPLADMEVVGTPAETVYGVFNNSFSELSTASFNNRKVVCSSLYNYLIDDLELSIRNPFKKLKAKKMVPVKRTSFWTLQQVEAILDNAPSCRHRLFYAFMAYAGLRFSEAKKLKREDIMDGKIYVVGKGKKIAFIPIGEKLRNEMEIFDVQESGIEYNFQSVASKYTFGTTVKRAGAGDDARCSFHRLRHSFGSNLIRAGANVKAVQLLMRHSSIQTTLNIYAHLLDGDLLDSVNLLR